MSKLVSFFMTIIKNHIALSLSKFNSHPQEKTLHPLSIRSQLFPIKSVGEQTTLLVP